MRPVLAVALGLLAAAAASSGGIAERLGPALDAEARLGFSGVVLVAQGGAVVFERAYGGAAATGIAPGRLPFWIASDSKQFTAAAILRLQELGRLRVADSLPRFFARVPADKRAITLHQLLTHTSGLPTEYSADGVADRTRAVEGILRLKLRSAPGRSYAYSNDGFTLLAAVIEVAAGIPFDTFMRDSIFARAGLEHTGLWGNEAPGITIAPPADAGRVRRQRPTIYRDGRSVANWGYRGPTGAYSTARDLHDWIAALRAGRVIGRESLKALTGRHVLVRADSTGESWTGYGWGVRVEGGRDVSYGHTGGEDWLGHTSVLRFTPAGDVVVVLANSGEHGRTSWATRANRTVRRVLDGRRADR